MVVVVVVVEMLVVDMLCLVVLGSFDMLQLDVLVGIVDNLYLVLLNWPYLVYLQVCRKVCLLVCVWPYLCRLQMDLATVVPAVDL